MGAPATVGIIANPSSGKDIRRLVARGSVFDNVEKINIVRRALIGLAATGVRRVLYMPDYFSIVPRAVDGAHLKESGLSVEPLDIPLEGTQRDSEVAAGALATAEVGSIITLGGDGTNRVVAKGCRDVPLVPISTGTNNVFPSVVEGTLAGLAAGLVATSPGRLGRAVKRAKRLDILVDGRALDLALVDVALSAEGHVGSRAVWDAGSVRELVLAIAEPGSIGLSAIGAHLSPISREEPSGLHLSLATVDPDRRGGIVLAPIAPGLVEKVMVVGHRRIAAGDSVELGPAHGTLALDGEREIVVTPRQRVAVRLNLDGPLVVDVAQALGLAAREGMFVGMAGD